MNTKIMITAKMKMTGLPVDVASDNSIAHC